MKTMDTLLGGDESENLLWRSQIMFKERSGVGSVVSSYILVFGRSRSDMSLG